MLSPQPSTLRTTHEFKEKMYKRIQWNKLDFFQAHDQSVLMELPMLEYNIQQEQNLKAGITFSEVIFPCYKQIAALKL